MKNPVYISHPISYGLHIKGTEESYTELKKILKRLGKTLQLVTPEMVTDSASGRLDKRLSVLKSNIKLYNSVLKALNEKVNDIPNIPVVIGGDHSLAIGSVSASSKKYGDSLSVVWIDAHADINTFATSSTKNIHGMPLANLIGLGDDYDFIHLGHPVVKVSPNNVYLFGIRDIDAPEFEHIKLVNAFTMEHIRKVGIETILNEMLSKINTKYIHISFDVDALDPSVAPGVSTPVKGGFTEDEIVKIFDRLLPNTVSIDIVEYNPLQDKENKTLDLLSRFIYYLDRKLSEL